MALSCGPLDPMKSFNEIAVAASTEGVEGAEGGLGGRIILQSGEFKPLEGFSIIAGNTSARGITFSQVILGEAIARFRALAQLLKIGGACVVDGVFDVLSQGERLLHGGLGALGGIEEGPPFNEPVHGISRSWRSGWEK